MKERKRMNKRKEEMIFTINYSFANDNNKMIKSKKVEKKIGLYLFHFK
jgi:hypothetical protein